MSWKDLTPGRPGRRLVRRATRCGSARIDVLVISDGCSAASHDVGHQCRPGRPSGLLKTGSSRRTCTSGR